MAEITRKRQGELVRGVLEILRDAGGSLHVSEVLARLEDRVPPTPFELTIYENNPGVRRYEKIVRFATISPVKAGWIGKGRGKDRGLWTLLEEGDRVLRTFPDPVLLMLEARRGYRAWKASLETGTDPEDDDDEVEESFEPTPVLTAFLQASASTPVFKKVDYVLNHLLDEIATGQLAVPELQRPFRWKDRQVRNLLDSMYRGYPVGNLLLWEFSAGDVKQIGAGQKSQDPDYVIVDGQQRLTSLYAVLRGEPVMRDNRKFDTIQIAFRPADRRFEVANPVIRSDAEWIPNISEVWSAASQHAFVEQFLETQRENVPLTKEEEAAIATAIDGLFDLAKFPFTALQLNAAVPTIDAAEIFVRINSGGITLTAADFILTLMSVYWPTGRDQLEEFCRDAAKPGIRSPSPYTPLYQPGADDLVRVSVALAFDRADLQQVYSYMRGGTSPTDVEARSALFAKLETAQSAVLDLTNWHAFITTVIGAGFRTKPLIASKLALMYAYAFYLIGRVRYKVPEAKLRPLIARWFFMAILTARYTASGEAKMEQDLARVVEGKDFLVSLESMLQESLNEEYWTTVLPADILGASKKSPIRAASYAALILQDAPVLFSTQKIANGFDPAVKAKKGAVEDHHLFPASYLESLGFPRSQRDRLANLAPLEYTANIEISNKAPSVYLPAFAKWFDGAAGDRLRSLHALSPGWEALEYEEFLSQRSKGMSQVIRSGYERLGDPAADVDLAATPTSPDGRERVLHLIASGEGDRVEFKRSFLWSHFTQVGDIDPLSGRQVSAVKSDRDGHLSEFEVVRAIAGLMNNSGGTLLIGVDDKGGVPGLAADFKAAGGKQDADAFAVRLQNRVAEALGASAATAVKLAFSEVDGAAVCVAEVARGPHPAFFTRGDDQRFFVRSGATTRELKGEELIKYVSKRWPA